MREGVDESPWHSCLHVKLAAVSDNILRIIQTYLPNTQKFNRINGFESGKRSRKREGVPRRAMKAMSTREIAVKIRSPPMKIPKSLIDSLNSHELRAKRTKARMTDTIPLVNTAGHVAMERTWHAINSLRIPCGVSKAIHKSQTQWVTNTFAKIIHNIR